MQSSCDPEQKAHVNIDVTISISPFAGFFPLSNFSFLPSLIFSSSQPGRTQLKVCSGLLHHPILSSHLISRLWRHLAHGSGPSPRHLHQGALAETVQGVAAGRPPALSGRLLRPGKPRRGEGDSSRCSQPEELSCGRALAPTTRHIPAPSCESNWHSVAW